MESEVAKRNFLIKVGVGAIMSLILVFWFLNIKNVFVGNSDLENKKSSEEVLNLKDDFNEVADKMTKSLEQIGATNEKLNLASSSLVNELIIETNKIASSTNSDTISTSTTVISTSSLPIISEIKTPSNNVKNNCPVYINCMPSVGAARPCTIPPGCEGVTLIAY
ncbi:MAG: hypothetical protein ACOYL8_01920 [Patescibacteria group bacterium]